MEEENELGPAPKGPGGMVDGGIVDEVEVRFLIRFFSIRCLHAFSVHVRRMIPQLHELAAVILDKNV